MAQCIHGSSPYYSLTVKSISLGHATPRATGPLTDRSRDLYSERVTWITSVHRCDTSSDISP